MTVVRRHEAREPSTDRRCIWESTYGEEEWLLCTCLPGGLRCRVSTGRSGGQRVLHRLLRQQRLPKGVSLSCLPTTIEDFGFPITLAFSNDGRVYLTERLTGRLWRIDHEEYRLIKTFSVVPLIGHNETGLLGMALDPDFETNGYMYCYYTAGTSELRR